MLNLVNISLNLESLETITDNDQKLIGLGV